MTILQEPIQKWYTLSLQIRIMKTVLFPFYKRKSEGVFM